ncbi:hypothetical protein ACILD6_04405 [Capnocytophaga canimorsus]|uniref:hypothetical protein n=1 Tax=Capnocytophaga canimorsus TaxID=28188 RepID=UPI0037CCFD59
MKKIILLVLTAVSITNCNSSVEKKNDLQKVELKGKVKSVRTAGYTVVEKFGEIRKGKITDLDDFINFGSFFDSFNLIDGLCVYNEKGDIIEINRYNSDGSLNWKGVYKYDNKGNKIEENGYNSDGSFVSKMIYKYDDKDNLIEENWSDSSGNIYDGPTYKYDDKGNQIEKNHYHSDGSFEGKQIYKYDDKGNQIELNNYNYDGDFVGKITCKYDDKGNKVEAEMHNDWNGFIRLIFKYDDKNNVVEMNMYDSKEGSEDKITFKYEFDTKGNWVKLINYENDKPELIIEREIEYYQ